MSLSFSFALMILAFAAGAALLALKDRIDRLGRDGMGKFADLRFFSFKAREEWRVVAFLFLGRHADPQTDALRITAMVMFAVFLLVAVLGVIVR